MMGFYPATYVVGSPESTLLDPAYKRSIRGLAPYLYSKFSLKYALFDGDRATPLTRNTMTPEALGHRMGVAVTLCALFLAVTSETLIGSATQLNAGEIDVSSLDL